MSGLRHAERIGRLRLARTDGVGPITFSRLLQRYGTAAAAIDALPGLAEAGGRRAGVSIPRAAAAERELEQVARFGATLLILGDADYPALLAQIGDPPPALSVLGDVGLLGRQAIGLVGARNASLNGLRIAEELARDLSARGFVVVSGLARGIDAAAHRGALAASAKHGALAASAKHGALAASAAHGARESGRTVAAIAGGLDRPYPAENAALQARIASEGAVVAEAALGTAPQARHFPRRNRVIAGLSLGTVVVEAAPRSGSLITARLAGEYGRELFAVPGSPLDPRSRGSNDLIRQGAFLTETAEDVVGNLPRDLSVEAVAARRRQSLSEERGVPLASPPDDADATQSARQQLLALLGPAPTAVDDLIRRCHLSPSSAMVALLELELAGRIETLPGNHVCLLPGV